MPPFSFIPAFIFTYAFIFISTFMIIPAFIYFPAFIFIQELILFTSNHHLYNIFKIYSFQVSFIFTFLDNSELLLKEDNDKYLKLASYQF